MVFVGRPLDHRKGRWANGALALALGGLALGGCADEPSFVLRWTLADADGIGPDRLTTVEQCSSVGVSRIRATTYLGSDVCSGVAVDAREYPCFPADFADDLPAEGPTLEPGDYTVVIEGLRRTGEPWACERDLCDPDPNLPRCVAGAATNLTVAEGSAPLATVELLSPPECDDGIDNDHDGRVDGRDPACILDPANREVADASVTVFQTSVSFLDRDGVKPFNVGVDALLIELDGEQTAVIHDYDLDLTQSPFALPLLSRNLDVGIHQFTVTAVDAALVPLTQGITDNIEVFEDQAGYLAREYAFTADLFLAPIVQPIAFNTTLLLAPGATSGPTCELGGFVGGQPITLDRVRVRVTDADSQLALDAATLGLTGFAAVGGSIAPVDEPGGWVSFECPSSAVNSIALTWGAYDIEVEGRIGADACFATPMIEQLAPQPISAQDLYLDRVLVDGLPPAACRECVSDGDCSNQICVDNVCVNK